MRVEALELAGFRNYAAARAEFGPAVNVLVGENAQGKTNLLEALVCLSGVRSPRVRTERELIGFSSDAAHLTAEVFARERAFRIELDLARGRRRRVRVNGVSGPEGVPLHTVLFRPEDLDLIRAGAAARRRFLDNALCQLRPRYAAALAAYRRSWEQKSRILKDCGERPGLLAALPEFSHQMALRGGTLLRYRCRFVRALREAAAREHRDCSGGRETLDVQYVTSSALEGIDAPENREQPLPEEITLAAALEAHMDALREAELAARQCLTGPHRDDLAVTIDGREARAYASQGQARTAALALKFAERELYKTAEGEYPVLLLDDVLSELDPRRQEFVLNRADRGQVLLTCCEEDRLARLLGGRVLRVRAGEIAGE